jgi:Zn-dependent peptidase ImmA (M78 family)
LPIDINAVASSCGLTIKQGRFINPDIEGVLNRSSHTVSLSEGDDFEAKNFTTAHEIGHFKLHEDLQTNVFTMHQLSGLLIHQGEDIQEDQANLFAASLLMPEKLVKSLWNTTKDIVTLSKIFGVPENVVTFRLKVLHLIP